MATTGRLERAVARARRLCASGGVPPLGPWGSNGTAEKDAATYCAARMKRDRLTVAAEFAAGKFDNLKAALIAAGLVRRD
jgi:hypothetical protein